MNFSGVSDKTLLGRFLRTPLRLIPAGTVVRILQGPLRGKKWIVGSSNHGCWLGSYEYEKRRLFERALREGFTVFDVGAHVGFYTLLASVLVGAKGKVFAFEPLPRNLHYLKEHLRRNRVENVSVVEAAVSDRSGFAAFEEGLYDSGGHLAAAGRLRVPTVTLDELVFGAGLARPDCLKMDIEGAEMLALRGAKSMLSRYRPIIFLATHGQQLHRECCSFLCSLGYVLRPIGSASLDRADEILACRS